MATITAWVDADLDVEVGFVSRTSYPARYLSLPSHFLKGSNWGPLCLQHDVCSYFYGAKHCNDEKIRAFWDWQVNCLGFLKGPCEAKVHSRSGSSYNAICT